MNSVPNDRSGASQSQEGAACLSRGAGDLVSTGLLGGMDVSLGG